MLHGKRSFDFYYNIISVKSFYFSILPTFHTFYDYNHSSFIETYQNKVSSQKVVLKLHQQIYEISINIPEKLKPISAMNKQIWVYQYLIAL